MPPTSPFRHGVLAFTDALGFKGIWNRADPASVIEKFSHLLAQVGQANKYPLSVHGLRVHLQLMSLSDTVVVACSSEAAADMFGEASVLVGEVASLTAVLDLTAGLSAGLVATRPPPI